MLVLSFGFENTLKKRVAPAVARMEAVAAKSEALANAKTELSNARSAMSRTMFKMFETVAELKRQASIDFAEVRAWLCTECGVSKADLSTFEGFDETLGAWIELLKSKHVQFDTIKSLVSARDDTRAEAIRLIELGHPVDAALVRSIGRSLRQSKLYPLHRRMSEQRLYFRRKIYEQGRVIVGGMQNQARELYRLLTGAPYNGHGDYQLEREAIKESVRDRASKLLATMEELCGSPNLDVEDWLAPATGDSVDRNLSEARHALELLIDGYDYWRADDMVYRSEPLEWTIQDGLFHLTGLPLRKSRVATRPDYKTKFKSVELCAGIGGEAVGLMAAGFHPLAIVDNSHDAVKTLDLNWPSWKPVRGSIKTKEISSKLLRFKGQVDLLAGGVPCQPFSRGGARRGEFDNGELFSAARYYVEKLRPRAFAFENVMGFMDRSHSDFRRRLTGSFEALGYDVEPITMKAADFGLAQRRERIVLVGLRHGYKGTFRPPVLNNPVNKTFADTIVDVLFPYRSGKHQGGDSPGPTDPAAQALYDKWTDHWITSHGHKTAPTLVRAGVPTGSDRETMWLEHGFTLNIRLEPMAVGEITAYDQPADLTVDVIRRLQGFPDAWQIPSGIEAKKASLLLANAFPPIMARALGLRIREALTGDRYDLDRLMEKPLIDSRFVGPEDTTFNFSQSLARTSAKKKESDDTIWRRVVQERSWNVDSPSG